jgi:hypothetical protein
MTPRQWRPRAAIVDTVRANIGLDDRQLAHLLGTTTTEIKPVIGYLIGTRQLDVCQGYLVLPVTPTRHGVTAA